MKKRVGVTGIGIITALGHDLPDLWNSLKNGETGIVEFEDSSVCLSRNGLRGGAVAELPDLKGTRIDKRGKKLFKKSNKIDKMAICAGLSALDDAGLSIPLESPLSESMYFFVGTGTASGDRYIEVAPEQRSPVWFLETYPNYGAALLSIIAGICGHCANIVAACTGSTQAIGNGLHAIRNGYADIALCGGFDSKFSDTYVSGFSTLGMLSQSSDVRSALRPFDKDRNGFVLGEGACFLVLESYQSAGKRGVRVLGEICGYGNSLDGLNVPGTSWTGKSRAMNLALKDAGIGLDKIDYINAHGTGTIQNDREETYAIKSIFGKKAYRIPINSTKSMTGHTFSACGAIESAVSLMSIDEGIVHVTRNHKGGDQDCDLNYVARESIAHRIRYCLMNTSGIGGFNASLVIGKSPCSTMPMQAGKA
jgi:3-oxoacyl-[acyl-carrier-protein] synthase II